MVEGGDEASGGVVFRLLRCACPLAVASTFLLEEESKVVIAEYESKQQAEQEEEFLPRMKLVITRIKQMEKELPELCSDDVLVVDSEAESMEL